MSEIIVYLDDYKYGGDGYFETLFLDFRTMSDYERFVKELNIEHTEGTYIQINGYSSKKRLFRGSYYALNTEMLKQVRSEKVDGSLLLGYTFYFNNSSGQNDTGHSLLQSHTPLDPTQLYSPRHNRIERLDILVSDEDLEFKVNNVSQASWNEIRQNKKVKIVYDIGAPIYEKRQSLRQYIKQYAKGYSDDKPCLILSHWDKDHYHCLLEMTDLELLNFSKFICVDMTKSATSQRLYSRLQRVLGDKNIFSYEPEIRTPKSPFPQLHEVFVNNMISLYVAEKSRNVNYSELILFVKGKQGHVLMTGDSLPCQANEALQDLYDKHRLNTNHYLVVPHHGGDYAEKAIYKTYSIPQGINGMEAVISVDEANNIYGHPSQNMLDFLFRVANWGIKRTDKGGTVVRKL